MSEEIEFIPFAVAQKIVAHVNEEEHRQDVDRRVLAVYDKDGRELCWFDADEVLKDIGMPDSKKEEAKEKAVEYVLNHIPTWSVEHLL